MPDLSGFFVESVYSGQGLLSMRSMLAAPPLTAPPLTRIDDAVLPDGQGRDVLKQRPAESLWSVFKH
jgi:hypothetical protein